MTAPEPWFLAPERAYARGARIHTGTSRGRCACEDCCIRRDAFRISLTTSPQEGVSNA